MKTLSLAVVIAGTLATQVAYAGNDRGREPRAFDVCIFPPADARFNFDAVDINGNPVARFGPGDRLTGVAMLLPAGTLANDTSGDPTCAAYRSKKIGTFLANGTFVSTFQNPAGHLPQAAANDLIYVNWHFRIDGVGDFDATGIVKTGIPGSSYPETIIGGTGHYKGIKGEMTVLVLGQGDFQFRVMLPDHD